MAVFPGLILALARRVYEWYADSHMTVYRLVAAVKVHLCSLSNSVSALLAGQAADRELSAANAAELNARLADIDARLAAIEASLVRIEGAVIEEVDAAGIRLTVTAQQTL